MQRLRLRYEILLLMFFFAGAAASDPFTGEFSGSLDGKDYRLSISGFASGQYEGEFYAEGERLPLNARRFGDRIAGQIGIADHRSGFLAELQAGGLLLKYEDGRVILFKRILPAREVSAD